MTISYWISWVSLNAIPPWKNKSLFAFWKLLNSLLSCIFKWSLNDYEYMNIFVFSVTIYLSVYKVSWVICQSWLCRIISLLVVKYVGLSVYYCFYLFINSIVFIYFFIGINWFKKSPYLEQFQHYSVHIQNFVWFLWPIDLNTYRLSWTCS